VLHKVQFFQNDILFGHLLNALFFTPLLLRTSFFFSLSLFSSSLISKLFFQKRSKRSCKKDLMKTGYIVASDHLVEQQFPVDVYADPLECLDIKFVGKPYSGTHVGKCYEVEIFEANVVDKEVLATKYKVLREVNNLSGELVINRSFSASSVNVRYTFVKGRLLFFTTPDGTVGTIRENGTVSLVEFPGGYKAIPKHLVLYQETLTLSQTCPLPQFQTCCNSWERLALAHKTARALGMKEFAMKGFQVWIPKDLAIQGWTHESLQGHKEWLDFGIPRKMRQYHSESVTLGIRGFHIYLSDPHTTTLRQVFGWGCVEADPSTLFASVQNLVLSR